MKIALQLQIEAYFFKEYVVLRLCFQRQDAI